MADARFQDALTESMNDSVVPTAFVVGFAYVVIGSIHLVASPSTRVLGPVEFVLGSCTVALALWCRGRSFSAVAVQRVSALIVMPVVLSNALFIYYSPYVEHTFGLYIVCIGTGVIAFTRAWFARFAGASAAIWCFAVWNSGEPLVAWVEQGIVMGATIALGAAIQIWRVNYLARLDDLKEQSERSLAARDRAQARFRRLTEIATDMIVEVDLQGRVLYANPAHYDVLGYSPEEMLGTSVDRSKLRSVRGLGDDISADLREGRVVIRQLTVAHRDGTPRTIEMHAQAFRTDDGSTHVLATSRDVTDRVALQVELERRREELEAQVLERTDLLATSLRELQSRERLASVGTLAAGIAHQINNPVAAILASAEYALVCENDAEERSIWKRALNDSVIEARRCGRIVRSILKFACNEATEKVREDLSALVSSVCEQCESYAEARSARIERSVANAEFPVLASAIELEQALLNIIHNGLEHGTLIEVDVSQRGALGVVTIRDDGPGVEDVNLAHVFDPFFTTRLSKGGTGLGLSVAHGIAADHGGELRVESAFGKGAIFTLELPLFLDELESSDNAAPAS